MTSTAPFGLPGEVLPYLAHLQQELWDVMDVGGENAAYRFLADATADGRLPRVVYDHILEWNRLKRTDAMYVVTYHLYVLDHLDDWVRDGLQPPDPDDEDSMAGGFTGLGVRREPVRASHPGRNDPCACGSGRKYKHCHGRRP